jgi:citrate synthase
LHGGANQEAMKMLREIDSSDRVDAWVKEQLSQKRKIMGFGHRIYQKGDARVPVMRELARQLGNRFGQEQWVDICARLEEVMQREKQLYANVDLYAAPVLFLLGIPPELNVSIFACGRIAGWCAHILEQHTHNRLLRPRSLYTGPARREYPTRVKKSAA